MVSKQQLEKLLDLGIERMEPVSGGCITEAFHVVTSQGQGFFLKYHPNAAEQFASESVGLHELAKAQGIRIPQVIAGGECFLLLEYIEPARPPADGYFQLGRLLAQLHEVTAEQWGLASDNWLGATPQRNTTHRSGTWAEFFWHNRLRFQLALAEENGRATPDLVRKMAKLEDRLDALLDSADQTPRLLHGDLWHGNVFFAKDGIPILFDPAVYYGHREADMAMTHLFGGFPREFYLGYSEQKPLEEGEKERRGLYKLYHLLNHLNMFGRAYQGEVMATLDRFVA